MKCSIFLLSFIGTLALADQTCQCDEPPVCIQSYPESCICEERAKQACWNKCGGPMPLLTGCPSLSTPVPEPEPESQCLPEPLLCATLHGVVTCECRNAVAMNKMRCSKIFLPLEDCSASEPEPEPQPQPQPRAADSDLVSSSAPGCLPEPLLCATLHGVVTCECRNAVAMNKMRCSKIFLPLEDCSAPEPQPQPQPRDTEPATDMSLDSGCLHEPLLCETLHGPSTCACRNAVALNKMRCTKIWLPLEDCSASPSQPGDNTCQCEETMCVQSWPESCYCENAAQEACYQKCGGEKPELQTCPSLPSQTLATAIKASSPIQTPAAA